MVFPKFVLKLWGINTKLAVPSIYFNFSHLPLLPIHDAAQKYDRICPTGRENLNFQIEEQNDRVVSKDENPEGKPTEQTVWNCRKSQAKNGHEKQSHGKLKEGSSGSEPKPKAM